MYDSLHAHKPHGHTGLGFTEAPAAATSPVAAPAAAPSHEGGDSVEDAVAKARAIAAKLGLITGGAAAAGTGGDSLKRKFGSDVM